MNRNFSMNVMCVLLGISFLPSAGMARQKAPDKDDCRQSLTTAGSGSGDAPMVVTMKDLQDNPSNYYGKTVSVSGQLHRRYTNYVFTIEGKTSATSKDILVVGTVPKDEAAMPQDPRHVQAVRVTGVVQPYDRSKLECAYGPLN